MPLPHVPTYPEVLDRASRMFASTRSLDAIVERAHRMVIEAVHARLAGAH
jgi:stearoyl-CoA desaturase (delta-9 desaturase)